MTAAHDEKIDWFRVIVDLCNRGYSHRTIAAVTSVATNTVRGWRDGARPRYEDGERLIALWSQVTGNSQETVHRINRHSHLC
ncbi:MAG: hypothetical protein A2143_05920 [Gallionellales bacterium RBG_16_57_15]|nr:MAG: hypothetical protein A2143_05920 [Gallionellales bacterium RBG_16_57_15]